MIVRLTQQTRLALFATLLAISGAASASVLASIDLKMPFGTKSAWQFTASQWPAVNDPIDELGDIVPGVITLCISNDQGQTCRPSLRSKSRAYDGSDLFADPHIGPKVTLTIVDGLLAQYAGGPEFNPNYSLHHRTLYASRDPVALDATLVRKLEGWRREARLPAIHIVDDGRSGHVFFFGRADDGSRINASQL